MDRKVIIISYKSRLSRWGMCSVAISDNIKIVMEQEEAGRDGSNNSPDYIQPLSSRVKKVDETATNFLGRGKCDDGKSPGIFLHQHHDCHHHQQLHRRFFFWLIFSFGLIFDKQENCWATMVRLIRLPIWPLLLLRTTESSGRPTRRRRRVHWLREGTEKRNISSL